MSGNLTNQRRFVMIGGVLTPVDLEQEARKVIMAVFDVFSKRDKPLPDVFQYDNLPEKLRNQIVWIWRDTILEHFTARGYRGPTTNSVLLHTRAIVCAEHGLHTLSGEENEIDDTFKCLQVSKDTSLVLDVIEGAFRCLTVCSEDHYAFLDGALLNDAIDTLNQRFRENGVGYEFNATAQRLIRVDNQLVHRDAVQPALALLSDKRFKSANAEFLEAFDDYKKGNYGDCLTKCCSSFESVLKILCKTKGWPFNPNGTAQPLLRAIISNTSLPNFLEQPLILIATLRNKLSKSHGAGTTARVVPDHLARYALHLTASSIVMLYDAAA